MGLSHLGTNAAGSTGVSQCNMVIKASGMYGDIIKSAKAKTERN